MHASIQHDENHANAEEPDSPSSTIRSAADPEKEVDKNDAIRYMPVHAFASSSDEDRHGVSVTRAEAEFAELSREFSNYSHQTRKLSRTASHRSKGADVDIEKSPTESDESIFNLEEVLRGARALDLETGIKSKQVGVLWEGLTVSGLGGVKNFVKTFPDAFTSFFNVPAMVMGWFGIGKKGREFDIVKDFKGIVKPGEMVLVLGRPSSGCTTFLKVISNQRFGYTKVDGNVQYGPFDAETFGKRFRGEAVYNEEDDQHHPALSVGQTLGFALDLKTPGKRPAGMSKAEFKQRVIDLLLKMFNIEHTVNTKVGGAFIRGISGGERKRVSIAEMMISSSCVCAWDNSTRGLDASTASDYASSLRILTNIYKTTTFVSLYQASETIYSQFDKVMVIDSGRQVFFGSASEARAYFESLGFKEKPRQTTPDYLTGCTDAYEREYKNGYSAANAPHDPESLALAFRNSEHYKRLDQEIEAYRKDTEAQAELHREFESAHQEAKRKHAGKKSVYTAPLYLQIWALMKRQSMSKWQDKFALSVSWATSLLVAIVLGTVWYKQPQTSAGAFTRGGLLFIALLFNAFQAFGELGLTMLGRPIVNKHRAFTFHRPGALWLGQIFVDTLFATVQITVFSSIVYFMCGLALNPGGFFTFVLLIVTGYLSMTLFFRTVGCLCPDFDVALRTAVVIITLFVLTSGYLIQYAEGQVWLRWIFYINGLGLGFSAMMINEFSRINLKCTSESLIPSGGSYNDINHQVCTLQGGTSGNPIIPGSSYLSASFSYAPGDLWRNFGVLIALIVLFLVMNVTLGEAVTWGAGGRTVTFFAKETKETKNLNKQLMKKKKVRLEKGAMQSTELSITSKAVLTWESLCYDVPVPGGSRRLLSDVVSLNSFMRQQDLADVRSMAM